MNYNINSVICSSAEKYTKEIPNDVIDLIITSPPYGLIRNYNGFEWNFEKIAHESYRILKPGGVLVWIEGDTVVKRSETLKPMEHAIYFKNCVGFLMHDTMIYKKDGSPFPESNRYWQEWEYMFVLSKGIPKTHNLQKQETKEKYRIENRKTRSQTTRNKDGTLSIIKYEYGKKLRTMSNVWCINSGYMKTTKDKIAYKHPAMFPEELVKLHILTWSNKNDVVLDYFHNNNLSFAKSTYS